MAISEFRSTQAGYQNGAGYRNGSDAPLGELLKRLSSDTTDLLRHEITLAKVEAGEVGANVGRSVKAMATAAGVMLAGALALTAFAVIALGNALGGRYWLSALIVGVLAFGAGAFMARRATAGLKENGLKPQATLASLRQNASWAGREAADLKRELRGTTPVNHNRG